MDGGKNERIKREKENIKKKKFQVLFFPCISRLFTIFLENLPVLESPFMADWANTDDSHTFYLVTKLFAVQPFREKLYLPMAESCLQQSIIPPRPLPPPLKKRPFLSLFLLPSLTSSPLYLSLSLSLSVPLPPPLSLFLLPSLTSSPLYLSLSLSLSVPLPPPPLSLSAGPEITVYGTLG